MKIAIFHNLKAGGALFVIENIIKFLKPNNTIDLYSHNENLISQYIDNYYIYPIKKTKNIFDHIIRIIFELNKTQKKIAYQIDSRNYDLVLIFPCILVQSPYLLRYLKKSKIVLYFFSESKREFYENTSFDHNKIRRKLARLIRIPIKYIDRYNCKSAKIIISNSIFTANTLFKIYKIKSSFVIYPGINFIKPLIAKQTSSHNFFSIGLLSKIKGHDFSIEQLKKLKANLIILGRETNESSNIIKIAINKKINLKIIHSEQKKKKKLLLRKNFIYLANQYKEPFGIATLEASSEGQFVLGKNIGGTPEIIQNGLNGILYNDNSLIARQVTLKVLKQKYINFYTTAAIDWQVVTNKILKIYHYLKHEPAE